MIYDLIIIGSGPAGLTASIYASRYRLSNLVIGKTLGGELSLAHNVCNFPGFIGLPGLELTAKWKEQVESLGARILLKEAGKIEVISGLLGSAAFKVFINEKEIYYAKALIAATGSERRRLNIPGEKEYIGKGVSYCTTCDVALYKGKTVVLVGGSDAAVAGAIHSANFAKKVYLFYRGSELRAEAMWVQEWEKIVKSGKGETIFSTNLIEIFGDKNKVTGVKIDRLYQGKDNLAVDGIFVEIGGVPGTSLLRGLGVILDKTGHVLVNDDLETNIKGLFSAGDMTSKSAVFKQAIWACAQGAKAAASAFTFIKKQQAPQQIGI